MQAYLLLGTNLGDRVAQLALARKQLSCLGRGEIRTSSCYESEPWGAVRKQPPFLNQAVGLAWEGTPRELLLGCLGIEQSMGRTRGQVQGEARTIDIDVLYCGSCVCKEADFSLPHPRMAQRRFSLVPMVELAATWVHPVLGLSQEALLERCTDPLWVKPYTSFLDP